MDEPIFFTPPRKRGEIFRLYKGGGGGGSTKVVYETKPAPPPPPPPQVARRPSSGISSQDVGAPSGADNEQPDGGVSGTGGSLLTTRKKNLLG